MGKKVSVQFSLPDEMHNQTYKERRCLGLFTLHLFACFKILQPRSLEIAEVFRIGKQAYIGEFTLLISLLLQQSKTQYVLSSLIVCLCTPSMQKSWLGSDRTRSEKQTNIHTKPEIDSPENRKTQQIRYKSIENRFQQYHSTDWSAKTNTCISFQLQRVSLEQKTGATNLYYFNSSWYLSALMGQKVLHISMCTRYKHLQRIH